MDLNLEGKHALVTGSTRGIGEAIARTLAAERAVVVVHGRNEERARAVTTSITRSGGRAAPVTGDLSTDAGAEQVVDEVLAEMGHIDILVNNAGGFEVMPWSQTSPTRWATEYNQNVVSIVRVLQGILPSMRGRNWGRIIQISSVSASIAPPLFPDYAAAKSAAINLSVSLGRELAGTGITVNTVSPGPTVTDTWERFALQIAERHGWPADLEETKTRLLAGPMANPSNRIGRVDDIATLVAYLASPLSGYINGENIRVDGGLAARVM